jgi:hypothetical protein
MAAETQAGAEPGLALFMPGFFDGQGLEDDMNWLLVNLTYDALPDTGYHRDGRLMATLKALQPLPRVCSRATTNSSMSFLRSCPPPRMGPSRVWPQEEDSS